LKSDFLSLINDCCTNNLLNTNIEWHNKKSLCIEWQFEGSAGGISRPS